MLAVLLEVHSVKCLFLTVYLFLVVHQNSDSNWAFQAVRGVRGLSSTLLQFFESWGWM